MNRINLPTFRYLLSAFLILVNSSNILAEPLITIRNNGNSVNRVDIIILGDGYTGSEQTKFANDAEIATAGFFDQEPFKSYKDFFNVHRIDVISNQSGADHPEDDPQVFKDTAFDSFYNCGGIERAICSNIDKVSTTVNNSIITADQNDITLLLVNDVEPGGTGGGVAITSLSDNFVDVVLHEIGHSFGLLADEYIEPIQCLDLFEPFEANATKETDRNLIKWNVGGGPPTGWIETSTEIPTTQFLEDIPGLYEGGRYCTSGLFRPTLASKMNFLAGPFGPVNEEQLVKRIYSLVSPLDSTTPPELELNINYGEKQVFEVAVPATEEQSIILTWLVNGQQVATGASFEFNSNLFDLNPKTIEVVAKDLTTKVRNDPDQLLQDSHTWQVTINPLCNGIPATIIGTVGNDIIKGTSGDDVILALSGNDRIKAGSGKDLVCGNNGRDRINGGAGRDRGIGGAGADTCLKTENTQSCLKILP